MDKTEIKWGFIGCGRVVMKKSGRAFNDVADSKIQAIMRRDIKKAEESARAFDAPYFFDKIDDILNSDIDAVYIATPPGLHYEQAITACKAGKPVYLEKPFARNYIEAKKIVGAFKEANIPLFIGHYRRALPLFNRIKEIIESSEIGEITSVQSYLNRVFSEDEARNTWLYNPALSGGGKFYDIAPHSIDIICYLFGNIVDIHGYAANHNTPCPLEDTVVFSYKTKTGVTGTALFNCIADNKSDRMFVYGTKGSISFSIHGDDKITISKFGEEKQTITISCQEHIEQPMVEKVVQSLLGKINNPCSGTDALPTYWAIDEVLNEFYNGRQREFWK